MGKQRRTCGMLLIALAVLNGCGDSSSDPIADEQPPPQAGEAPLDTLRIYYFYRDRGDHEKLAEVVIADSVPSIPDLAGKPFSRKEQLARDIVVDHEWIRDREARLYYRTWNSDKTREKGGWLRVAVLRKEGEEWRVDMVGSFKETLITTKGKTPAGFYDGTKMWWK